MVKLKLKQPKGYKKIVVNDRVWFWAKAEGTTVHAIARAADNGERRELKFAELCAIRSRVSNCPIVHESLQPCHVASWLEHVDKWQEWKETSETRSVRKR